ncbi:MAG: FAD-dependent oxidoreductase [Desulfobulbaceae bacterium]|uniref:FAD-dependent oxidoreductase n=1 Tax=Candidatus Desulfobia pelagia TaxID=2841692 RepID=A0A8J6NCI2_9BACT|nr:FAD-dependent oxidoreductase [Candidatus Desulfobia pelagia]
MPVWSIDREKCIGCGTCIESCPMDVFRLDTLVSDREECAPCKLACPLGVNPREYHNLIKMDLMDEAARLLARDHSMPVITGWLCPHPCETECSRNEVDTPVNINGLEQYLGERLLNLEPILPEQNNKGGVAIIGSGPAGLSAAYHLSSIGYQVTVYEKEAKVGGLLRTAIPTFRLPEEVLDKQIAVYEKMGIKFETKTRFGRDITKKELESQGYKAFIAATGASKPIDFFVPGSEAEGITSAIEFLTGAKAGEINEISGKVSVIGGGSVAMDAARTAVRLGADHVIVICLECIEPNLKDSMLALTEEIEAAIAEGIEINPCTGVDAYEVTEGRVSGIKVVDCLSVRDEDGLFNPVYGDSTPQVITTDQVILAIGQTADEELVLEEFTTSKSGFIQADKVSMQMDSNLFAAGETVVGPSIVVEALAAGKRAALAVDLFIQGKELPKEINDSSHITENLPGEEIHKAGRIDRESLPVEERKGNFQGTLIPFTSYQAWMEAQRCLTCGSRSKIAYMDDCQVCRLCQLYCPTDAIEVTEGILMGALCSWDVVNLGKERA